VRYRFTQRQSVAADFRAPFIRCSLGWPRAAAGAVAKAISRDYSTRRIVTDPLASGQQWDAPMAGPPLHVIGISDAPLCHFTAGADRGLPLVESSPVYCERASWWKNTCPVDRPAGRG